MELWLNAKQELPAGYRTAHRQVSYWLVIREHDLAFRFAAEHEDVYTMAVDEFEQSDLGCVHC